MADPNPDFWALKPSQLAAECSSLAGADPATVEDDLRAEAAQLATEWKDAIQMPVDEFEAQARRAAQIAALRKRTIEILVRVTARP